MNKISKKRLISGLLILPPIGFLCFIFIVPMQYGIINAGNIAGLMFCAVVALSWAFEPLIKRRKKLFLVFKILAGLFALGCAYVITLSVCMAVIASEKPDYYDGEGAVVVVLGCQVRPNGVPSRMLLERLKTARELLLEDESLLCVVTGGQGRNEPATEASVMRDWMIRNGISEERIFIEDKSTNTDENLRFARNVMLDNDLPLNVIIVSDGFHLFRAQVLIGGNYFEKVASVAAETNLSVLPTYWVREWFSITWELIY